MFHGIEIAIIDVMIEIDLVSNGMLPKSTLPNTAFAAPFAHITAPFRFGKAARELAFDMPQAQRKIRVALGQRDNEYASDRAESAKASTRNGQRRLVQKNA